jgi:photosystem II stability/assembly factor-like uncharacterized protein
MKSATIFIFLFLSMACHAQWKTIPSGTDHNLTQIVFPDSLTGYIMSNYVTRNKTPDSLSASTVYKTTDGGYNWKPVLFKPGNLTAMDFLNKDTGVALTRDTFCETFNGGKTWIKKPLKYETGGFFHINSATEWVYVNGTHYGHTLDGGNTWIDSNNGNSGVLPIITLDVHFVNDSTVIGFGGYAAEVFKSTDRGLTWPTVVWFPTDPWLKTIWSGCFPTASVGYLVGGFSGYCLIYKTTDGGINWKLLDSSSTRFISCIRSLDAGNLYAVGDMGLIMNTIDGGKNWKQEISGAINSLSKIILLPGKAIAIGDSGTILMNNNIDRATAISQSYQDDIRIKIYPNPTTTGLVNIWMPSAINKPTNLKLFDVNGRLVLQQNITKEVGYFQLKGQSPGIYFLSITTEAKKIISRILLSN